MKGLTLVMSKSYRMVFLLPSSRASDSIVIAWAGQMASQSLQAKMTIGESHELSIHDSSAGVARTNTPLLAVGIPSKSVFTTESRRDRSLLEWVHNGVRWSEELL